MLGSYPLFRYATPEISSAVIAGGLLATINVFLGFLSIEYSYGKSITTFFKYVLGGMGLRLLAMAIALLILVKVFKFQTVALVCSIGFFYIIFLVLEVMFIQKKVSVKHQS